MKMGSSTDSLPYKKGVRGFGLPGGGQVHGVARLKTKGATLAHSLA